MRVSVIVVNWNREKLLKNCVRSLQAQTYGDVEIIVVDNGSRQVPQIDGVKLICLMKNRGFAGGANAGIRASSGELVALINNDATANKYWLEELVKAADRYPRAGMFASLIMRHDGGIDSAGCYVHRDGNGMCIGRSTKDMVSRERWFPSGCAAMYRRSMLDKIGLFDERFFCYNEDTELGIRAQRAGYSCVYVPSAIVNHLGSQSTSRNSLKKLFWVERNRILIMLKHFSFWQMVKSIPWTIARYAEGGR
jgi:GT2 family glycosyltransferase